jgi:hypothetical protein
MIKQTDLARALFTMDCIKLSSPKRFKAASLVMLNSRKESRVFAHAESIANNFGSATQLKELNTQLNTPK